MLYVKNIAKAYVLALVTSYIFFRRYFLPRRKGAFSANKCTYSDIPLLVIVSLILDVAKAAALIVRPFLFSTIIKSFLDKTLKDGQVK